MDYFNTRLGRVQTEAELRLQGVVLQPDVLTALGLFPVEYPEPPYDSAYYTLEPSGIPHPKEGDPHTYVQDFVVTPRELSTAKAAKLAEIMSGINAMETVIKSRYSKLEIDSWPIQQTQAETVLSGGTLPEGALLLALANANDVSVSDFAARVMQNVAQAEAVTKAVVAQQQAYELALKSCTTVEEVQAITVSYTLPEVAA